MPEERAKIRAKARKLYVMSERGTEHERQNAQSILEKMFNKHDWLKASLERMTNPEIDQLFETFREDWNQRQRAKLYKNKAWGDL